MFELGERAIDVLMATRYRSEKMAWQAGGGDFDKVPCLRVLGLICHIPLKTLTRAFVSMFLDREQMWEGS